MMTCSIDGTNERSRPVDVYKKTELVFELRLMIVSLVGEEITERGLYKGQYNGLIKKNLNQL